MSRSLEDKDFLSFKQLEVAKFARVTCPAKGPALPSGAMAFQYIVDNLMTGITWDSVLATCPAPDNEQLEFFLTGSSVQIVSIEYLSATSWRVTLGALSEFYLLLENGDFLLQENGDKIIL